MLPTFPRTVRRPPTDPHAWPHRLAASLLLTALVTLLSVQTLYAQTDAPVRRDRHADREIQIRYPRFRPTPTPTGSVTTRDGPRIWRAGPAPLAPQSAPSAPGGFVRRTPQ